MNIESCRRALRCVGRFGPVAGIQAACLLSGSRGSLASVRLPSVGKRLWARRGTSDVATFDEIFIAREYDLPLEDFSPTRILDIGANVGYTAVCFAARWPRARIVAVEPAADNAGILRRNTAGWPAIEVVHAAVWSRPGTVCVANPGDSPNAYRMDESASAAEGSVPAYTIGQLLRRQGWDRADLVKMDVEGAEAGIFRADTSWLDRVDVLAIELHDRIVPGCSEGLFHALEARHFREEIVGRNLCLDFRRSEPVRSRRLMAPASSEAGEPSLAPPPGDREAPAPVGPRPP